MRIEWSEPSHAGHGGIAKLHRRGFPLRAKLFMQRLFEHVDHLESFPALGKKVPETDMPDIRELVFQGYRIIYHLAPQRIDILTVLHGSRDLNNLESRPWEA